MTQAVKVSDELYCLLKERARERGTSIKQALGELLNEAQAQAKELQALLAQKESKLNAFRATYESEKERHALEIASLEEEVQGLRETLFRYRARVEELSASLEKEKVKRKRAEETCENWRWTVSIVLPLSLVAGVALTDTVNRALGGDVKRALFPFLGSLVGAAVGNYLKDGPGLFIGIAAGVIMGELARNICERRQMRNSTVQLAMHKGLPQVT